MTVAELLDRITSSELTEWAAYERIEGPIGPFRSDAYLAQLAMLLANANRNPKKQRKPWGLADFFLFGRREKVSRAPDPSLASGEAIQAAVRATLERAEALAAQGGTTEPRNSSEALSER